MGGNDDKKAQLSGKEVRAAVLAADPELAALIDACRERFGGRVKALRLPGLAVGNADLLDRRGPVCHPYQRDTAALLKATKAQRPGDRAGRAAPGARRR